MRPLVLPAMICDVSFEGLVEDVPAGLPRFYDLDRTMASTIATNPLGCLG